MSPDASASDGAAGTTYPYGDAPDASACVTCSSAETHSHDFILYNVGFRCCSDP